MQYLTKEDLKIVVDKDTLNIIHQSDKDTLDRAEAVAIEEIKGYLRSRYDMEKEFTPENSDENSDDSDDNDVADVRQRNQQILMRCADIMLYHLISWMPKRLGWEIREIRYNSAIEWLEKVQKGEITPNLPTYQNEDGTTDAAHYRFQYGSIQHQTNVY